MIDKNAQERIKQIFHNILIRLSSAQYLDVYEHLYDARKVIYGLNKSTEDITYEHMKDFLWGLEADGVCDIDGVLTEIISDVKELCDMYKPPVVIDPKLNFNATTIEEAKVNYLAKRYKELASLRIKVTDETVYENKAIITRYDNGYISIYILEQYRNQGLYQEICFNETYCDFPILTMKDCEIVPYLLKIDKTHSVVETSPTYKLISKYYGDQTTKRSGVRLMNHIDEGITYLNHFGVKQEVIDAYCLHPILQSDEDFNKNLSMDFSGVSPKSLLLAMEYRHVANSYLSTKKMEDFIGFTNNEMKQLLYADKMQNYKDFKLYHFETHARSRELNEYFINWLEILLKDIKWERG